MIQDMIIKKEKIGAIERLTLTIEGLLVVLEEGYSNKISDVQMRKQYLKAIETMLSEVKELQVERRTANQELTKMMEKDTNEA